MINAESAPRRLFVLTSEQPYEPRNDVVVLGTGLRSPSEPVPTINRYLLAGIEWNDQFTDEALRRVRPDALQRLFNGVMDTHEIFGYQFGGSSSRLPKAWHSRLLYLEKHSVPHTVGKVSARRAMDRYAVQLQPDDFSAFEMTYGEEAWFRFFLLKPKGSGMTKEEFLNLNSLYAGMEGEGWKMYLDPVVMASSLHWSEALVWYTYSPPGRDSDGPHIGICTRRRWKNFLGRLFPPNKSDVRVCLDLNRDGVPSIYCLDLARQRLED